MADIDPNIPLSFKPSVPLERPLDQLQKRLTLMELLRKTEEAQRATARQEQYRTAIGALPPDASEADILRTVRHFQTPGELGSELTASRDRQAKLKAATIVAEEGRNQRLHELTLRFDNEIAKVRETAKERRITNEEADRREAAMRENFIRLTASLRQPVQPRQLQLTTDAQGNQLIVNPDGTTTPLMAPGGGGVRKAVGTDKPMTEFQGRSEEHTSELQSQSNLVC